MWSKDLDVPITLLSWQASDSSSILHGTTDIWKILGWFACHLHIICMFMPTHTQDTVGSPKVTLPSSKNLGLESPAVPRYL